MKGRRYGYTELGMLLGLFVGGGLAILVFATTGEASYFAIAGVGLALGLGLGAAYDGARSSAQRSNKGPHTEEK